MDPDRGELLKILSDHCGLVGDARIYPSQTGKFNRTFFVEGKGLDRPLVFRIAPPDNRESMLFYEHRMMRQEPTLHRILRRNTSVPVPEIVYHERQNAAIGRDLVVMERMPGNPMSHGSERLMHELGEKLREVHE